MRYSAKILGKLFGLNAREMNAALKELGYIGGQPGKYFPTEKVVPFYNTNYHSNGYGGYAARSWTTNTYDESIIKHLTKEMTEDVCKKAIAAVKEQNAANRVTNITDGIGAIAQNATSKISNTKANTSLSIKPEHVVAALVAAGIIATVTTVVICVKKSKKKKQELINTETIIEEQRQRDM